MNGSADITVADGTKLPLAGSTLTGQLVSTRANNAGNGQAQIYLNGVDSNRIDFGKVGIAAPSTTTRSAGTKMCLYPECSATLVDYAIGMDAYTLWNSVPGASSNFQFQWYAGTTAVATLNGAGNLSVSGAVAASSATISGDLTVNGNLSVTGNPTFANPFWVAVIIGFTGGNPYFIRANAGRYTATSVIRQTGRATGVLQFDFPAHPQGTSYVFNATASGAYATISTAVRSIEHARGRHD